MKILTLLFTFFVINNSIYAQSKSVALTMDDLFFAFGNTSIEKIEAESDSLLYYITNLKIPVTVFVNEKSLIKKGETDKRLHLYNEWITNPLVTIGNHTFSHKNYANTDPAAFEEDIIQGETITEELLGKTNKSLKYFRFPFNCTGKDSISRAKIYKYLNHKGYVIAPFTIESMDYMYNALYCNFIKKGKFSEANKIIEEYIDFTVVLFRYFENLTNELYGRNIKHIFLCHTNPMNAACLDKLVMRLKENGYRFISLDQALEDKIYQSKDYYTGKFGFSWIYRWIENAEKRKELMRREPYSKEIEQQYDKLISRPD